MVSQNEPKNAFGGEKVEITVEMPASGTVRKPKCRSVQWSTLNESTAKLPCGESDTHEIVSETANILSITNYDFSHWY